MTFFTANFLHDTPGTQYDSSPVDVGYGAHVVPVIRGAKVMNPQAYARRTLALVAAQCMLGAMACMALAACASQPSRAPAAAAPVAAAATAAVTPSDQERRNRQFQQAEALYLSGHLKEAATAFEQLTPA